MYIMSGVSGREHARLRNKKMADNAAALVRKYWKYYFSRL